MECLRKLFSCFSYALFIEWMMSEMSRKRDQKMTWMEMFKAVKTRKKEEKVVRAKRERERIVLNEFDEFNDVSWSLDQWII